MTRDAVVVAVVVFVIVVDDDDDDDAFAAVDMTWLLLCVCVFHISFIGSMCLVYSVYNSTFIYCTACRIRVLRRRSKRRRRGWKAKRRRKTEEESLKGDNL